MQITVLASTLARVAGSRPCSVSASTATESGAVALRRCVPPQEIGGGAAARSPRSTRARHPADFDALAASRGLEAGVSNAATPKPSSQPCARAAPVQNTPPPSQGQARDRQPVRVVVFQDGYRRPGLEDRRIQGGLPPRRAGTRRRHCRGRGGAQTLRVAAGFDTARAAPPPVARGAAPMSPSPCIRSSARRAAFVGRGPPRGAGASSAVGAARSS